MNRLSQNEDESAIDYLRRVVSNLDYENESTLQQMPSVEAILDYYDLFYIYDTDLLVGILECIEEEDSAEYRKPMKDFIRKHKLPWLAGDQKLIVL